MSFCLQLVCLLLMCASACANARLDYRWDAGTGWVKTNETRYVYDGMLPIQERDETNGVRVSYVRGMDFSGSLHGAGGIGGLLARQYHSTLNPQLSTTFYHSDGAGNITSLSDAQEGIAARYLYEPFGRLVGQWGPLADANAMRFSSKPRISPGGDLYDYGFRIYTTRLQRWTSRDPLGEAGGVNLYGFVGNSPVNAIDPWGEEITYFTGDNSFGYPSGSTPYLGGDTVFENLVAGAYNAIPLLNNILEQGAKPLNMLGEAVAEAAGDQFGSQVEDGTRNLMAVLPFLLSKKCPPAAKTGGNVGKMADDVLEWLGPNSTMSKPPGGSDLVLRSADGTKQIRFDLTNPHGLYPHVNVETFKPRNLFPGDRKMIQTGNDHVFPKP